METVILKKDFLNNKKGDSIDVSEERKKYLMRVGVIDSHNDLIVKDVIVLNETKKRGRKSKK